MTYAQPIILAPTSIVVDAFAIESLKIRYFKDIEYEKLAALEARVRAIKGGDLYYLVRAVRICLVPNMVVPKKFHVPEFINIQKCNALPLISNHSIIKWR